MGEEMRRGSKAGFGRRLLIPHRFLDCAGWSNKRVTKRPKSVTKRPKLSFLASRGASDLPF
jgi:hypothetical protein